MTLKQRMHQIIIDTLEFHEGNVSRTARHLTVMRHRKREQETKAEQ